MTDLHETYRSIVEQYEELERQLADPAVASDPQQLARLGKQRADLEEPVEAFREYERLAREREDNLAMLAEADRELRELIEEETRRLDERLGKLRQRLRVLLVPKDPDRDKNAVMEIRAGTGGEEAALFARDLYDMYTRLAERRGWKTELMNLSESDMGGVKEAILAVEGPGAYGVLKHESGVHRVQRVPQTESSGRIHTSAATVAVLPEAEEIDVHIDPDDLDIKATLSGGPGGQSVQKNATAIRIRHIPTGIQVYCQDERSQRQNKQKALRHLRSILYNMEKQKRDEEIAATRREQVKSGDRSEKIRTYNFPQQRVTDHRIGYTSHNLEAMLAGELDDLVQALQEDEERRLVEAAGAEAPS
ncbi:MAG: peptide chain release factor 1 [Armatimonadota bacterium]